MTDRVVEDQGYAAEDLIYPHTVGRALFVRPQELPQEADRKHRSNADFWRDVLDPQQAIAECVVCLEGFNVFEWIPRNPGLFHTSRAAWAREEANYHIRSISSAKYWDFQTNADGPPNHAGAFRTITSGKRAHKIIYTPQGKSSMLQGGVGCVRLRPVELKRGGMHWFMSATSSDAPDEGIPLLVPDAIYRRIIDEIRRTGNKPCNIIGRTKFIPAKFSDLYSRTYRIQRLYIDVESLEQSQKERPAGEVSVATSFLSEFEGHPKIYASYVTFDPGFRGAQESATEWMKEEYVEGLYKGTVLTDFDQQQGAIQGTLFSLEQVMTSPDLAATFAGLKRKVGYVDWDMFSQSTINFQTCEEHVMVKSVVKGDGNSVNIATGENSSISGAPAPLGPQPTPQEKYRHLYTLLAFGTGTVFLAVLLAISLIWPNPTPPQLKVQAAILALAAAGFATVMSGLMNLKAKLGTQLVVGATGALAVLVLFYLFNPAVLR